MYQFGLRPPGQSRGKLEGQFAFMREYRRRLVDGENAKRDAIRDLRRVYIPLEVEASRQAEAAAEEAWAALSASPDDEELWLAHEEAKARRKEAWRYEIDAWRAHKEAAAGDVTAIESAARDAAKRAYYQLPGLYWGNRQVIDEQVAAAAKPPPPGKPWRRHVAHARRDSYDHVRVQFIGGTPSSQWVGTTQLRIQDAGGGQGGRRSGTRYAVVAIRVGTEGGEPEWAELLMVYHRPLPLGTIKKAEVTRRRVGRFERWSLEVTVDCAEVREVGPGRCGLDVGWCVVPGGVRVGYWAGDDGEHGEFVVSRDLIGALERPDSLRATRDKLLNEMRATLAAELLATGMDLLAAVVSHWRSPARFATMLHRMLEVNHTPPSVLVAWVYRDRHLWDWEVNQREQSRLALREQYRRWIAQLARRYGTVVVESSAFSITQFKATEGQSPPEVRRLMQLVAPGAWRKHLPTFGRVVEVDPAYTTMECPDCGHVGPRAGPARMVRCEGCGWERDQDHGAARVLCERAGAEPDPGPTRVAKYKGKFVRRKEEKAEREALELAAREEASKAAE